MMRKFLCLLIATLGAILALTMGCTHTPTSRLDTSNIALDESHCTRQNYQQCLVVGQSILNKAVRTNNAAEREGLFADAAQVLINGCQWGDPGACYDLGMIYSDGKYQAKDYKTAQRYYTQACNENLAMACANLGEVYLLDNQDKKAGQIYRRMCTEYHDAKACQISEELQRGITHSSYFAER
ncbi:MAG: hypothetical protein LUC43_05020 [Burkholderiales bacterium]|nr:hypothetical protein [Burkholderiales bacterium]